jgi:hypothetical protein
MPDPSPNQVTPPAANVITPLRLSAGSNPWVAILLTAILVFLLTERFMKPGGEPTPVAPVLVVDPHFVALGKAVEPQCAPTYAQAWLALQQALTSGQPLSACLKAMEDKWAAGRQSLTASIQAEMGKIVPAGTKDADFTPTQRAALSAAAGGVAQGLNKGKGFPYFMPLSWPHPAEPAGNDGGFAAVPESKPTFEDRVKLVSQSLSLPEPTPALVLPSKPDGPSKSDEPGATPPPISEVPPARSEPNWHWRYFAADPRIEAWGYLDEAGTFIYTATRWRVGQPVATFAPVCVGGSCGR